MMTPNPEFDKAGYCCKCHVAIAEFDGDQKIVRLLGSYRLVDFLLDDKSVMRVALCEECKAGLQPEHTTEIMESVYKGWVFEMEHYLKWPEERRKAYTKSYGKKFIVGREDGVRWTKESIEKAVGKKNMAGVEDLEAAKKVK